MVEQISETIHYSIEKCIFMDSDDSYVYNSGDKQTFRLSFS